MTNLVSQQEKYQKFEIYADVERINKTWADYGHYTAPMAVKDLETGEFLTHTNNKVWWQNDKFMDVLNGTYTLYPNEPVDEMVHEALDTKLGDMRMFLMDTVTSHNDRTKYWKIVSEQEFKVTDLPNGRGDDTVRIGCVVRNGMGTNIALGIDLFTFRPFCGNGAVIKGRDMGSVMWRHVGKEEKMKTGITNGMVQAISNCSKWIKIYEKTDTITVNSEIASKMYQDLWWIGETYLPSTWNVKKLAEITKLHKEGKIKGNDKLISVKKEVSLWDTFNQITENHRDRLAQKRVSFGTVAYQQDRLHKSMIKIVNGVRA